MAKTKIKLKFEDTLKKLNFDENNLSKKLKAEISEIRQGISELDDEAEPDLEAINKDDANLVAAIEKYVKGYPRIQAMQEGRVKALEEKQKAANNPTPPAAATVVPPVIDPPPAEPIVPVVETPPITPEPVKAAEGGEVEGEKKGGGWGILGIAIGVLGIAIGVNWFRNRNA